jgi:hypothetical protein
VTVQYGARSTGNTATKSRLLGAVRKRRKKKPRRRLYR